MTEQSEVRFCSFCGKNQFDVERIINGPGVCICINCVSLCGDILKNDKETESDFEDIMNRGNSLGKIFNINKNLIELEKTDPLIFFEVAEYIKEQLEVAKLYKGNL